MTDSVSSTSSPTTTRSAEPTRFWTALWQLLHRYAGLFIAPFIFVAAFTGMLYAITPALEQWLYQDQLTVPPTQQSAQPLSRQVEAAQQHLSPHANIVAVRPADTPTQSSRIIFNDPSRNLSNQAVFIDPYTLQIKGQLAVYGTSGVLPLRTTLDHLHRDLLLGETGRLYSELAASWLGLLALSGFYQWIKKRKILAKAVSPSGHLGRSLKRQQLHSWLGLIILPFLVFFSVTGLTWSNWAGDQIGVIRQVLGWQTPVLQNKLQAHGSSHQFATSQPSSHEHSDGHQSLAPEHTAHQALSTQNLSDGSVQTLPAQPTWQASNFDTALGLAREHGLTASKLQIRPARDRQSTWIVEEIDHRWPIQVDSVSLDISRRTVVDQLQFEQYPLVAKLIRWGIDAHIGVLFGWLNQLVLALVSALLCLTIVVAYRAWGLTHHLRQATMQFARDTRLMWQRASLVQKISLTLLLIALSIALPVFGFSIAIALVYIGLTAQFQKQSQNQS